MVRALKLAAVPVALWVLLVGVLAIAMRQPPETFGRFMSYVPGPAMKILPFQKLYMHARAGRLRPGDPAPDFTLQSPDRKQQVQLSAFQRKQPVVLVFGSYT